MSPLALKLMAAALLLAVLLPIQASATQLSVQFFTQTGFAIADDTQSRFFSEFRRLGGVDVLGYPSSQPFTRDGFRYQVFQRAVLQWRPEANQAYFANVLDWMSDAGKDAHLASLGIPNPLGDHSNGDFAKAVAERESWLTNPAIAAAYRAGSGYQRFGLPASLPQQAGPFVVQRFQRYTFQLWTDSISGMPARGSVVGVLVGDLLNQSGLVPADALMKPGALQFAQNTTAPWPGATAPDPRFGTVQVSDIPDGNGRAADLGLSWSRELFLWNTLGDSPDVSRLQYTSRYYSTPLGVAGLILFTPPYAGGAGNALNPPSGLRLPWNDPNNHFGQFAFRLAQSQSGKVDTWIVWNEPDICAPSMFGYSWSGSPEDYYYMLKTGYQAIKNANPNATVVFASLGIVHAACHTDGTDTTFFNRWLAEASRDNAAAGNWFFDALALNIHKEPERIYELIRRYKALMQQRGFDKPIWLMETSVPVRDESNTDGQDFAVDKGDQQSYLIQAYANALAAGASRVAVYKLAFFAPEDPAYRTLKTAIRYMSSVQFGQKTPDLAGSAATRFTGVVRIVLEGPGFRTTVLYNRGTTPARLQLPALGSYAYLANKHGNELVVAPEAGAYSLDLEPASGIYRGPWGNVTFVGGSPLMLRELR